ncbi:MAG: hypothetical protein ACO1NY_00770 [Pseudorhodoplanes sp.]
MTAVPAIRSAVPPSLMLTAMLVMLAPNSSRGEAAGELQLETLSLEANDPVYRIESDSAGVAHSRLRPETTGENTMAEHDVDMDVDFIAPAIISDSGPADNPVLSNAEIAD